MYYTIGFEYCCGAGIVYDLQLLSKEEMFRHLDKAAYAMKIDNRGMLYAITNPAQEPVRAIMEEYGFKVIQDFNNPIHGSHLKLLALDLNKVDYQKLKEKINVEAIKKELHEWPAITARRQPGPSFTPFEPEMDDIDF